MAKKKQKPTKKVIKITDSIYSQLRGKVRTAVREAEIDFLSDVELKKYAQSSKCVLKAVSNGTLELTVDKKHIFIWTLETALIF